MSDGDDARRIYERALSGDKDALAIVARWKKRSPHADARLAQRYADALQKLDSAESDLARSLNRWLKHRAAVRRYQRELDKLAARATE